MSFSESVGDVVSKVLELVGLKKSEGKQLLEQEEKLRAAKAANVDRLEELKQRITQLERSVRGKKEEYDKAKGATKRVVAAEIERLFGELDMLKNRETILGKNLEQLALAIAKLQELRDAKERGVDADVLDDIAVDLEDIFADLKTTDRAAKGLREVTYEPEAKAARSVDERLAAMDGEGAAAGSSDEELSADTLARIAEMEEDEK